MLFAANLRPSPHITTSAGAKGTAVADEESRPASSQSLASHFREIESRDWQLWSLGAFVSVFLTAGFIALVLPDLLVRTGVMHRHTGLLPQLFTGLGALVALLNVYLVQQRRNLNHTRNLLMQQLLRAQSAEELSLQDPLTGAYNRRFMEQAMVWQLSLADRQKSLFSVLLVDLDDFKNVNTRFGHLLGDHLLRETVQLMRRTLRASDLVVRYGGDEFVAILPDATAEQARVAASRLQRACERWNIASAFAGRLQLSCGIATYSAGDNLAELLRRADVAMYQEKSRGKSDSPAATASLTPAPTAAV